MYTSHVKKLTLKLALIFILSSLFVSFPLLASAFKNEPTGFRGIKFGTDIRELPDMRLLRSGRDTKSYVRENEKLKIGDADIKRIVYSFYKNRLYAVFIYYEGYFDFLELRDILCYHHGEGCPPNRHFLSWTGTNIEIMLYIEDPGLTGFLAYFYKPIEDERARDRERERKDWERERKEGARKGARDLY